MADAPAKIVLRRQQRPDETFLLTEPTMTIGRSDNNEICIPDPEVSRRHAQITRLGSACSIEDLGSTNGTFVNGRRLAGVTPLKDGDVIYLGETIQLDFVVMDAIRPGTAVSEQDTLYDAQFDTPPLPLPVPSSPLPAPVAAAPPPQPDSTELLSMPPELPDNTWRRWVIGCGCLPALLLLLCMGAFFFLDAYQEGRLLYCGGLRPFFEVLLGPFGFAPICP